MSDDLDDDLDPLVFEAPRVAQDSPAPAKAGKNHHPLNTGELATYIYPTNLQIRDYQYNIVYRSLFHNVLVALPTGLGKTFIASTVILNYMRWFPESKIIFMAPTKPLVAQQIKACCGITGIAPSKTAILLDKVRRNRADIWAEKQIFFTTPQVVENDLATGIVDPKLVVLLVIDEAHRAKGNYAYNNVAKFLFRFNPAFRILAMTATPASDVEGVQEIVDNLLISKVEVRTERSIDIYKYLKRKTVERYTAEISPDVNQAIELLCEAVAPVLKTANDKKVYEIRDPAKINAFTALDAQQRLVRNPSIPEGQKWANYFILQLLIVVGQCLRRLNIYGIRSFYNYFREKHLEFTTKYNNKKLKNHMAAAFYQHPSINKMLAECKSLVEQPGFLGHRKLEILISQLQEFFNNTTNTDSRVIIFTEFRESALDIVRAIEYQDPSLKPHIFIGQAGQKEKFDEVVFLSKGKKAKKAKTKKSASTDESQTSSEQAQATGMNQKMQKSIIKQFKDGVYNILVATSIGEEGLDIGEVDLIVCYDSTSSPIKNVQRMGRTGRNREGKVVLLFSSNEESKFDKAMSGYEYIQQHIMNGNLVRLHPQNRIIPSAFSPLVHEMYIDIPEENAAFKNEDDEDEIIKIANDYMTGSKRGKRTSKGKKTEKITKRFFMPDDVVTGFQLAGSLLHPREEEGNLSMSLDRTPDILDSILDSDEEQEIPRLDSSLLPISSPILRLGLDVRKELAPPPKPVKRKFAGQPQLLDLLSNRKSNGSALGVKRRTLESTTPQEKELTPVEAAPIKTEPQTGTLPPPSEHPLEDDIFDDDFFDDDEVLALAKRTQSKEFRFPDLVEASHTDSLFEITGNDGLLDEAEQNTLFFDYFAPVDVRGFKNCDVPLTKNSGNSVFRSSTAARFISSMKHLDNLNDIECEGMLASAQLQILQPDCELDKFIE